MVTFTISITSARIPSAAAPRRSVRQSRITLRPHGHRLRGRAPSTVNSHLPRTPSDSSRIPCSHRRTHPRSSSEPRGQARVERLAPARTCGLARFGLRCPARLATRHPHGRIGGPGPTTASWAGCRWRGRCGFGRRRRPWGRRRGVAPRSSRPCWSTSHTGTTHARVPTTRRTRVPTTQPSSTSSNPAGFGAYSGPPPADTFTGTL